MDSLFDLEVSEGSLLRLGVDGIAMQKPVAEDKGLKVGDDVRVQFPEGGPKTFTVQALFDQTRVPQIPAYVISTKAFEANYLNVFDPCPSTSRRRVVRRRRTAPVLEKTLKAFPIG